MNSANLNESTAELYSRRQCPLQFTSQRIRQPPRCLCVGYRFNEDDLSRSYPSTLAKVNRHVRTGSTSWGPRAHRLGPFRTQAPPGCPVADLLEARGAKIGNGKAAPKEEGLMAQKARTSPPAAGCLPRAAAQRPGNLTDVGKVQALNSEAAERVFE